MSRYYHMRRAQAWGANPYRFTNNSKMQLVCKRMDRSQYALAFIGAVVALTDYATSDFYRLTRAAIVLDHAANGRYLKVRTIDRYSGKASGAIQWVNAHLYYRLYDSMAIFELHRQIDELTKQKDAIERSQKLDTERDLSLLSQNTVTRALVHAHDNDYCSETAVALISAGHKMPDVTMQFEVITSVSITLDGNSNYYALRALFGATRGEVQGASHVDFGYDQREKLEDLIQEQLGNGNLDVGNFEHIGTDVHWPAPILRQVAVTDAMRQVN